MKRAKISSGGQISVPAQLRKRWGARAVTIEDRGDHAVIRPAASDPVAAARGALREEFAAIGKSTERLRQELRDEDLGPDDGRGPE